MAIGTTAAIIGSAVIGAGAGILGSKAQSKAAGKAADASEAAAQAQLQLGREGLAFNRDIYNANFGLLSPYVSRGNVAGDQINALLGLGRAPAIASPLAAAPGTPYQGSGSSQQQFDDAWASQALSAVMPFVGPQRTAAVNGMTDPSQKLKYLIDYGFFEDEQKAYNAFLGSNPIQYAQATPATGGNAGAGTAGARPVYERGQETFAEHMADMKAWRAAGGAGASGAGGGTSAQSARSAFDQFANSAGMDFQLDLARDELQNFAGGNGWLQSGAAIKEATDRAQQIGIQNYFLPYMQLLGGQQGAGLQAGSAVAGVGSNAANTAAGINAGMAGAIGTNAANIGNLALAQGQNKANMWAGLGSSFGQALGAFK